MCCLRVNDHWLSGVLSVGRRDVSKKHYDGSGQLGPAGTEAAAAAAATPSLHGRRVAPANPFPLSASQPPHAHGFTDYAPARSSRAPIDRLGRKRQEIAFAPSCRQLRLAVPVLPMRRMVLRRRIRPSDTCMSCNFAALDVVTTALRVLAKSSPWLEGRCVVPWTPGEI